MDQTVISVLSIIYLFYGYRFYKENKRVNKSLQVGWDAQDEIACLCLSVFWPVSLLLILAIWLFSGRKDASV